MAVSVFDLFKIGIGPSSSHTVGPMRAARMFTLELDERGLLRSVHRVVAEMFGSLGATGKGHGTDTAVLLGLAGHEPDTVDVDAVPSIIDDILRLKVLMLNGICAIGLDFKKDILLCAFKSLPLHPNGMRFTAFSPDGAPLLEKVYYSVGGGFVVSSKSEMGGGKQKELVTNAANLEFPFKSGADLLRLTSESRCSIADVMRRNELYWRDADATTSGLLKIWGVMRECVERGCRTEGALPSGFKVKRRAAILAQRLKKIPMDQKDPLVVMDWVNLYALAVNEENAAGGRVVTAPTNGAAGIIPAVLNYYTNFIPGADERGVLDFLLTAGAIGILYKENASISGAEVGCQGEVGVACSMAAAGLCAVMGGTPAQVENAAEIGMEHHLGLTCDPVGGLVQIPCIERNAVASVKAINAARMAMHGDGTHHVSLDKVIKTMRETGADMLTNYKETSRGGLAVNIVEC